MIKELVTYLDTLAKGESTKEVVEQSLVDSYIRLVEISELLELDAPLSEFVTLQFQCLEGTVESVLINGIINSKRRDKFSYATIASAEKIMDILMYYKDDPLLLLKNKKELYKFIG